MYRCIVRLNGTDVNPFARFGLKCNPFPQIAKQELMPLMRLINELGGEPIKDEADLRERLKGATPEFIAGCLSRFEKGKMVEFEIVFPQP